MAVKWSAEMDQRLLLLIIGMITINWTRIASRWAEVYGQQNGPQPTKKAIIEHVAKLRKMTDGGNANPRKVIAGRSSSTSFASGSSSPRTKAQTKASASSSKVKGKCMRKLVDSDSDDSEIKQEPIKKEVKEEGGGEEQDKPLFGRTEPSTRISHPRSARPAPGRFKMDCATSLDSDFIMTEVYESDDEYAITVQNAPTDSPALAPKTSAVSAFADAPAPWTQNSPTATPTLAPRTKEIHDDKDECIVVASPPKNCKREM